MYLLDGFTFGFRILVVGETAAVREVEVAVCNKIYKEGTILITIILVLQNWKGPYGSLSFVLASGEWNPQPLALQPNS